MLAGYWQWRRKLVQYWELGYCSARWCHCLYVSHSIMFSCADFHHLGSDLRLIVDAMPSTERIAFAGDAPAERGCGWQRSWR